MRGPRVDGIQTCSKPNGIADRSRTCTKKKVLGGIVNSSTAKKPRESKNKSSRKRNLFEDNRDDTFGPMSNFEVIVMDGKWDTTQAIPSLIGEVRNINDITNVDNSDHCCFVETRKCPENLISNANYSSAEPAFNYTSHFRGETLETSPAEDNEDSSNLTWLINFRLDSIIQGNCLDDDFRDGKENDRVKEVPQFFTRIKSRETSRMLLSDSHENVERSQFRLSTNRNHHMDGGIKKPPFTYTELIEQALREKGELTVSGIYNWISEHFPFYKADDDRWKNSVRHNLSINPHFRKGCKASQGAGHLWTVANLDLSPYAMKKQQRIHEFMSDIITVEEVQAATASIEENKENRSLPEDILIDTLDDITEEAFSSPEMFTSEQAMSLEQSAEEILSGVKKEVEVQYLIPIQEKPTSNADFLNPVSKDIVVQESGLMERDGDVEGTFLVTDLNPIALEINMVEPEVISPDTLFSDDMDFEYYEFTPQQLQV